MSATLPDVSITDTAPNLRPLDWVGMQGIDVPVTIDEPAYHRELHATADVQVDLPAPHVKGIHMSRLYRLLDEWGEASHLTPPHIRALLQDMIDSHHDCNSRSARLLLDFDLLVRRHALITPELSGWRSYPVQIRGALVGDDFSLSVEIKVTYSSTCPCSAALSRQLVEESFAYHFRHESLLEPAAVAKWLRSNASLATPHSQRSEAQVKIQLKSDSANLGLLDLINQVEDALGTPVQTAVKRADEQAFAALNGQNLMFVEDAARRIQAVLTSYNDPQVYVRHLESLHPHDASAWSSSSRGGKKYGE